MNKVDIKEYTNYIEYAQKCTANRVYPLSIAAGIQDGDIYTDGNGCVLFWHYCGFAYVSGTVSSSFLEEVYWEFLANNNARRFLLITDSQLITDYYSSHDELLFNKRIEYTHNGRLKKPVDPDNHFVIDRIGINNIEDIQGRIIPSFSWANNSDFLKYGFGFLARRENDFAAVAFSRAVSSEEVDIGVETCENYRRNGLASYLSYKMCEEIIRQGKHPVWAHAEKNEGSRKTAFSVGFKSAHVNTVIRKRYDN